MKQNKMKKYWLTWNVNGQKKNSEILCNSIKEAESAILKKHKPKAIPYEDRFKTKNQKQKP